MVRTPGIGFAVLLLGTAMPWTNAVLTAQEPADPRIDAGARVRVTHLTSVRVGSETGPRQEVTVRGTVQRWDGEVLTIAVSRPTQLQGTELDIPRADLTRLEMIAGTRSNFARGALIGAGALGGLGAVLGLLACSGDCEGATAGEAAVILGGVGAGAGLVIGGVIGLATRSDAWQEVPLETLHVERLISRSLNGKVVRNIGIAIRLRI